MASRQDILTLEKDREESATWNVIHMFKEGSFWHAYEWSAWIICAITYNNEKHKRDKIHTAFSVNSYLGVLSHSASYNLRKRIFLNDKVARVVEFDDDLLKSKPKTTKHTIRKTF